MSGKQTSPRRSVKWLFADRGARIILFRIRERAHVVCGFGRLPCCGEDRPVVALEHLAPVGDVLGRWITTKRTELQVSKGLQLDSGPWANVQDGRLIRVDRVASFRADRSLERQMPSWSE